MLLFSQGTHEETIVEYMQQMIQPAGKVMLLWAFVCPPLPWHCFPPTFFDNEGKKTLFMGRFFCAK